MRDYCKRPLNTRDHSEKICSPRSSVFSHHNRVGPVSSYALRKMGFPTERKRIKSRARFMLFPTVAVLIALGLTLAPLVHAGNGSWLGTQTITDNFMCPGPSSQYPQTETNLGSFGATAESSYGSEPACSTYPGQTLSFWTNALGTTTKGSVDGGVSSQSFDCGQEAGNWCNSYVF